MVREYKVNANGRLFWLQFKALVNSNILYLYDIQKNAVNRCDQILQTL